MIVDVFCIVLALIVGGNVQRDSGSETQVRYFQLLIGAYLVFVASDAVWAFLMFGGVVPNNPVLFAVFNGINKIAVAFTGYFWFCYSLARFESRLVYSRTLRLVAALPIALVPVLYVAGFVLELNLVFLGNGAVANGPTYLAITGIALFYLVAATIAALRNYGRATTKEQRRVCLVFIAFMIAPAFGAIFDAAIPNKPIMAPSMMVSILLVLMSLQESRISVDALTGLNNRRRADAYLEECLQDASPDEPVFLFIADMDRFKAINDTYGHLEGDRALQIMAEALRKACANVGALAARWGGDEFVVIAQRDADFDPVHAMGLIKARLVDEAREAGLDYELSCSIGYARADSPGVKPSQLAAEADHALYAAKRAL